jgi:endonuclease YncB( thermonuclease family)
MNRLAVIAAFALFAVTACADTITGKVTRGIDGDTIVILDSTNGQHRIRLLGIDAPEKGQAFSAEAKKTLSTIVFGKKTSRSDSQASTSTIASWGG